MKAVRYNDRFATMHEIEHRLDIDEERERRVSPPEPILTRRNAFEMCVYAALSKRPAPRTRRAKGGAR